MALLLLAAMSARDAEGASTSSPGAPRVVGRYLLHREIASGGMATVHVGRLLGPVGFSRTVAIKRLHPQFERDPEFVAMFLDEARIAARIRHPNVVQTLDVVATDGELFLVMDYVEGESLAQLIRAAIRAGQAAPPARIVVAVLCGALQGLHAAHEARGENGQPLGVVHRDISPQNILVGADGTPRVLDFGIAKAMGRLQATRSGQIKGKLAYMAPEQIRNGSITRRTDIYAAGVVLWEALTGARLFKGDEGAVFGQIIEGKIPPPSSVEPSVPTVLDAIVLRAVSQDPEVRHATALDLARDLAKALDPAPALEVAEWVNSTSGTTIKKRAELVASVELDGSAPRSVDALDPTDEKTRALTPRAIAEAEAAGVPGEVPTQLSWRRMTGNRLTPAAAAFAGVSAALLFTLIIIGVVLLVRAPRETPDVLASPPPVSVTPSVPTTVVAAASTPTAPKTTTEIEDAGTNAKKPAQGPVRTSTTSTRVPSKPDPCIPPFFMDKDGFKTYKPGCAK
jgi:eukaryotic-like serine/threonine-protein kinase